MAFFDCAHAYSDPLSVRTLSPERPLAMDRPFHNVYSHGFVRAAVCIPHVRVADPAFNAGRTLGLARRAHELHAAVALFPELGISAYSNDDLFHQSALLDGTVQAL